MRMRYNNDTKTTIQPDMDEQLSKQSKKDNRQVQRSSFFPNKETVTTNM